MKTRLIFGGLLRALFFYSWLRQEMTFLEEKLICISFSFFFPARKLIDKKKKE